MSILNAFTDAEREKLKNVEESAQKNVQSNWKQSDNTKDDFIKNKPLIVIGGGYFVGPVSRECTLANNDYKVEAVMMPWPVQQNFVWDGVNNRFNYVGATPSTFNFTLDFTSESGTNNTKLSFKIFKNGTALPGIISVKDFLNRNKQHRMGLNTQVSMSDGDYIELFVSSDIAGVTASISYCQMSVR